ncbi:UDP-N-acetylmuramoyl-L-alanyl-D-glutamate--2,6-diaminopimelate ligase [Flaviflexus salsibiostraticola]|uniref:UDP-N-acetylmuramyl-tripeptide synthetase n=1 Tax=Flaviflexus salsibiostraticola TaxID=1282737 RepID=A0A3S8Z660_9ACTO|nr:UDP-N-acetylmuramoyl-L-alanyl-D-glutamate--2,6-diaminopimelate ligase [Flaviflexus salsibiostraticola]AZN28944.1 UDP-N-acetylmuramoyl-L-alanyl-D-glutamate--2,6-diaminopimelate ligase [Flaviflexus salsibiostraticola]
MKLSSLAALGVAVTGEADIVGVAADNRTVAPGDLFAGVPGEHVHGARFAADAVGRGAAAVLTDEAGAEHVPAGIPVAIAADVAAVLGRVAALVYGEPADRLRSFAVTGTNGKTTTAYMVEHILARLGCVTGLVGTVALQIAGEDVPASLTTPQPADLQRFLADLVAAGGTDLVMEVSSHALAQRRTDPIRYTVAGFTNLTQDHLDYHETLEEYFEAKALLFAEEKSERGVIWTDDEYGALLHERLMREGRPVAWAGRTQRDGRGWLVEGEGEFTLTGEQTYTCQTGLPGDFNVANAALAAAMVLEAGVPGAETAIADISPAVPGRMEVLSERPRVVVDFAHNADALEKAISSLRRDTAGRLITLTGSAGDRDALKRPIMGRVVAEGSDVFYLTDDDPHSEDPATIRAQIRAGAEGLVEIREIGDRAEAIADAILTAGDDDTVLLAGRGHETIQEVGSDLIELDDRVVARDALARRDRP